MNRKITLPKYIILMSGAPLLLALVLTLALLTPQPVRAAGTVGDGTPGSCTEANLRFALTGGGLVTFNCGSNPITITLTAKDSIVSHIEIVQPTVIDGDNLITLQGDGTARIFNVDGSGRALTLDGVTLRGGRALLANPNNTGGAINVASNAVVTATDSILIDNQAEFGGAIYVSGNSGNRVTLIRTAVISNAATAGDGGAIRVQSGSANLVIVNSTFAQNSTTADGGVFGFAGGTTLITNTTIVSNSATGTGGAIRKDGGTVKIKNTIVATNTATTGANCAGTGLGSMSNGSNIDSGTTCSFAGTGDRTNTNPRLSPLADHGGNTLTFLPLPGSLAVNTGDGTTCSADPINNLDQRNVVRPQGSACDRGAVEAEASLTVDKQTTSPAIDSGGVATYTITIHNSSALTTTNVVVTDTLPAGFTFKNNISIVQTPSISRPTNVNPAVGDSILGWAGWNIFPNGVVTITFSANVSSTVPGGTYHNSAEADGNETSPAIDDGSDTDEDVTILIPELAIDKETSTPTATAGGVATYTIAVHNIGQTTATGVAISDTLPSGFTFKLNSSIISVISATRTITSNPLGGGTPTWSTWTINPGGAVTITFAANIAAGSPPGTYNNIARTKSNQTSQVIDDGTDTDEDVTLAGPVLAIDKGTSTPTAVAGGVATYTIVVRNVGLATATGVVVSDTLPSGFTFKFNSSIFSVISATRTITSNPGLNTSTPVWRSWTIEPGGSVIITFGANIAASQPPGTYNNIARTRGNQTDEAVYDGVASDEDVTLFSSDLTIDKDTSTPQVNAGGVATYTIVVRNTSGSSLTGVVVNDTLPAGFTFGSGSVATFLATRTGPGDPVPGSNTLLWESWTLDPSGVITITFNVNIAGSVTSGIYQNIATASSDQTGQVIDDGSSTDEDVQVGSGNTGGSRKAYLPLVVTNFAVPLPDLVVDSISISGGNVQIILRNQGTAPVNDEFWVDFYVNPDPPPTRVNEIWNDGRSTYGAVWGVTASALPSLGPGGSLVLTTNDPYYRASLSNFPGSLSPGSQIQVFAQVDSANSGTDYGAVLESHEAYGDSYNNILDGGFIVVSSLGDADQAAAAAANPEDQSAELPPRP